MEQVPECADLASQYLAENTVCVYFSRGGGLEAQSAIVRCTIPGETQRSLTQTSSYLSMAEYKLLGQADPQPIGCLPGPGFSFVNQPAKIADAVRGVKTFFGFLLNDPETGSLKRHDKVRV